MTEYKHPVFRINPTIKELDSILKKTVFFIKDFLEPKINDQMKKINPKVYNFHMEFPMWWFFHLVKGEKYGK